MNKHYIHSTIKASLLSLTLFFFLTSTAQVQPPNQKITKVIYKDGGITYCGGYLLSLPLNYAANPTKKYPLLIFNHGVGGVGDGSHPDTLVKVENESGSVANRIKNGIFPASFTVDGEEFSFIVVSPQYVDNYASRHREIIPSLIDTCKALYRIDTSRIYITGLSLGGYATDHLISEDTSKTNKFSAALMVCPSSIASSSYPHNLTERAKIISKSNIPVWITGNSGDITLFQLPANLSGYVDTLNLNATVPKTIFTKFTASGHDAWTRTYNPNNTWDGLNVYQWMLQYTNAKLTAKAGPDQTFATIPTSVLLNGSKSHARQGRITSFVWTKLSGPASGTLTPDANGDTATLTGITAGVYSYRLTVTHTNGSTKSDTINVNITAQTQTKKIVNVAPEIRGFWESLPTDYPTSSPKKYPLIIYLHGSAAMGTGSIDSALDKVTLQALPKYIKDGQFPASFIVDGKAHSFIVLSPQYTTYSNLITWLSSMIQYAASNYRVDTSRIYLTGHGVGGLLSWSSVSASSNISNKIAAEVLASPSYLNGYYSPSAASVATPAASNLPIWASNNSGDDAVIRDSLLSLKNFYNSHSPQPDPEMKVTLFAASGADSWTQFYNPATKVDGFNVYEWMLQYTNDKLVANAGPDQLITSTAATTAILNGAKSKARQGRITNFAWLKLSGSPASGTASGSGKQLTINSLVAGTYSYQLTVTHTDGTTKKDTVNIVKNNTSPRIAGKEEIVLATPTEDSDAVLDAVLNPNPVHSQVTVWLTGKSKGKASVALYSLSGQQLAQQQFIKNANEKTSRTFNVARFTSGTYVVQVIVDGKYKRTLQFIKY